MHACACVGVLVRVQVLEEAPEDADMPQALLNVSAADGGEHAYLYTLRLGHGVITSLACDGDRMLAGLAGGALCAVQLVRGGKAAVNAAKNAAAASASIAASDAGGEGEGSTCELLDSLVSAVEEFSDDEDDEDDEGDEDSEDE